MDATLIVIGLVALVMWVAAVVLHVRDVRAYRRWLRAQMQAYLYGLLKRDVQ